MKKLEEYIEFDAPINKNPFVIGETYSWENEKGETEQGIYISRKGDRLKFEALK